MFSKLMRKKTADVPDQEGSPIHLLNDNIPEHVAIIMDGNGRWASKRGLPRIAGHREGMKIIRRMVKYANKRNIKILTMYAFSTENWKRPKNEVEFLLKLPEKFLRKELPTLIKENVVVRMTGSREDLPNYTLQAVDQAIEATRNNNGLILNFALNYGSRFEMLVGMKSIFHELQEGKIKLEDVNEEMVSNHMMTVGLKDPDLLIRTSGEIRLSNFMLWQLAYTEFWFTEVLWPDFSEEDFEKAIQVYQSRQRRFGGI